MESQAQAFNRFSSLQHDRWLPVGLAFSALVVQWIPGVEWLCSLLFVVPLHEWGHALGAWATGRLAFPLGAFFPPAAMTLVSAESYAAWSILQMAGLLFLAAKFFSSSLKAAGVWAVLCAAVIYHGTWKLSVSQQEYWFVAGGPLGEVGVGALAMAAFHLRLPEAWRWDFFRIPVFFSGAYSVIHSVLFWKQIEKGTAALPWGSLLGGVGDSNGDLQRLTSEFGWKVDSVSFRFTRLAAILVIAYSGVYVWTTLLKPAFEFRRRQQS